MSLLVLNVEYSAITDGGEHSEFRVKSESADWLRTDPFDGFNDRFRTGGRPHIQLAIRSGADNEFRIGCVGEIVIS